MRRYGPPVDDGLPVGWRLRFDRRTRRPRPHLLAGGSPARVLRLSPSGAGLIGRWQQGSAVPEGLAARRLARVLTDRGLAHPMPAPAGDWTGVVVIPVRDRATGLASTLDGLAVGVATIVVDDGSVDPRPVQVASAARPGTRLVRHDRPQGPAGARNTGWRRATSPLVAFVDADVDARGPWLAAACAHLRDPTVGAVAPRVVARPGPRTHRLIARYEAVRSPLDMGPEPAPVRPRSRVPYVPTTALVVRRQALLDVNGFDEALATGEDVDLVWRLAQAGWRVVYEPSVEVGHPTRDDLRSWLGQRVSYGRSAASLAERHGGAVAPVSISGWTAAAAGLAVLGLPAAGIVLDATAMGLLVARFDRRLPRATMVRLAVLGRVHTALGLAAAGRRAWWPLAALIAVGWPRSRRALAVAFVGPPLGAWCRHRPRVDPLRWTLLHLADDLAYGAGVWMGALSARRLGALRPQFVRVRLTRPTTPDPPSTTGRRPGSDGSRGGR